MLLNLRLIIQATSCVINNRQFTNHCVYRSKIQARYTFVLQRYLKYGHNIKPNANRIWIDYYWKVRPEKGCKNVWSICECFSFQFNHFERVNVFQKQKLFTIALRWLVIRSTRVFTIWPCYEYQNTIAPFERLNNNEYTKSLMRLPKSKLCRLLQMHFPNMLIELPKHSNMPIRGPG